MNWRVKFALVALVAALLTVIVGQGGTIEHQRALIRSFYNDPVCMHRPQEWYGIPN